jgi:hypothetical protein
MTKYRYLRNDLIYFTKGRQVWCYNRLDGPSFVWRSGYNIEEFNVEILDNTKFRILNERKKFDSDQPPKWV